ncbi:MAG: hypothetical protein OHK0017_09880 [Patescibacteria group bacterium]
MLVLFFAYITSVIRSDLLSRQKSDSQDMRKSILNETNDLITQKTDITSQSKINERVRPYMLPLDRSASSYRSLQDLQDEKNRADAKSLAESGGSQSLYVR